MKSTYIISSFLLLALVQFTYAQTKISVMAFEMSRCPYCAAWKQNFNDQVVSAEGLTDIIDLQEFFVGTVEPGNTFQCFHGPLECVGNKILLCATNLTTSANPLAWWNMGVCMQSNYTDIPNNAESCAASAGLNWNDIETCANGDLADELFTQSITVSNKYGIQETPTIYVNGKEYVGGPKNPLGLICGLWTGTKPAGCSNVN
eukprot:TRINITY_DN704_c0_g1_i1.p1 TRINITY_DN704_c0_g1~~TRINITY_DN704_c0_g1_i1.p1  ORF type:complete len:203 (-),score=42.01 TRINITY_DN704_c0_g1_i1:119-727(-)